MIGIGMLALFALFAGLMYARVLPALLAVPCMALSIAALAGAGPAELTSVLVDGSVKLAPVFAYVIFGALLSRVTMSTGIAETIVSFAAEFGGDQPVVLTLALAAAVAALFTSLYGLGAIIMVGSIVLPIMMTIGIPRRTAATIFMLAYALGFIFNISQWGFYTKTFGVERTTLQAYAFVLAGIDLLALIAFIALRFRSARGSAAWALASDALPTRKRVTPAAVLAPVLPIVLYFALGLNPVVAFLLAALYGVLLAKPREAVQILTASAIRGVEDVAPAIVLFMGIGMLLTATALPEVRSALAPVVGAVAPRSPLGYVLLFGVLSPLALYRGPLNPFGVGIGVYTVLASLGILPAVTLVAAIMAVVQVQNVCDPTNTQNVWVANFTGVRVDEITKLTLPCQVAVATLATLCVVLFGSTLVGVSPFVMGRPAAAAETQPSAAPAPPGLYAPSKAQHALGVESADTGPLSAAVADVVRGEILRDWSGYRIVPVRGDPAASDCARKRYAAVLRAGASVYPWLYQPQQLDVDLELFDCAGWLVDQWHEQDWIMGSAPSKEQLVSLGLAALARVQGWMREEPTAAQSLMTRGLAYDPRKGPTYWYTLFKTIDGQMRAYVRPGGPAYEAGLRTNDIVVRLDGKFWWEYGTFQTQSRAYDGMPHLFEVTRDGKKLSVQLGEPYRG